MINFFSADYHLGHENIIKYCNRPFDSLDEMNRWIIRQHNERISNDDVLFHVGDFCFKNSIGGKEGEGIPIKANEWEQQLNGKIIHVRGNHDRNNSCKTIIEGMEIKIGRQSIWLVHNPKHANLNYAINFVGHMHEKWKFYRIKHKRKGEYTDLINVGVDVNRFMPKTFEEIMKEYYIWRNRND